MRLKLFCINTFVSTLLLMTTPAISGNWTDSGNVTVSVTVTSPTCTLAVPDTVDLGEWGNKDFLDRGFRTKPVSFDVTISNCNENGMSGQLQYTGTGDTDNSSEFALETGDGTVGGIALHLSKDSKGNDGISPGGNSDPINLPAVGEAYTVETWASFIQTKTLVTAGHADASVTISLIFN